MDDESCDCDDDIWDPLSAIVAGKLPTVKEDKGEGRSVNVKKVILSDLFEQGESHGA